MQLLHLLVTETLTHLGVTHTPNVQTVHMFVSVLLMHLDAPHASHNSKDSPEPKASLVLLMHLCAHHAL